MLPHLTTVKLALEYVHQQFQSSPLCFGHGSDNAWDEAVFLVMSAAKLPLTSGEEALSHALTKGEQADIIRLMTARIQTRKPLAYLLNEAWFAGMPFYVNEDVLIPRSPFAEWIEKQFTPWLSPQKKIARILDLCTGSGCIAIALARAFPEATVDASDLSSKALAVAKINVEKHELQDRVNLIESDVFQALPKNEYDLIVSNPPYVDAEEMASLEKEFQHEPALGLAAGVEGLSIVKIILAKYKEYLTPDGTLFVEVGNSAEALETHFPDVPFTWLHCEQGGHGIFML
jgi:ribosomal protein L3 glutamine methyltransferase